MSKCKFCGEEGKDQYECDKKKPVTIRIAHGDLEAIDDFRKGFPAASRSDVIGECINLCMFNLEKGIERLEEEMKGNGFKKVEE